MEQFQFTELQYQMNFAFNMAPNFGSPQEMANYYNSLCTPYDYAQQIPTLTQNYFQFSSYNYPYPQEFSQNVKQEAQNERPTDDMDHYNQPEQLQVKVEIKMQQFSPYHLIDEASKEQLQQLQHDELESNLKMQRQKNLKKNTESNMINNVFSYICSESKSHRIVLELTNNMTEKLKIFYIFINNFKRINGKYLNRKNIKSVCQIVPKQPHHKMLSKSIKRLMTLPMNQFRVILRKLIFYYLRGSESILPLLTSKKICKSSLLEHLAKRRELCQFLTTSLVDYN